jgi:peroxiredoxin
MERFSMTRRFIRIIAIAAATALGVGACSPPADTAASPARTEEAQADAPQAEPVRMLQDFTLNDQAGQSHSLYAMKDAAAVVLIMQGVGCPIVQKMTPGLKEVVAEYAGRNIQFLMVNSNIQDTPEAIAAELTKFELDLPVLKDADQKLGRAMGAERTAEVFVVDPKSWSIVYHGPLDDRLTYGAAKAAPDHHYVKDVLNAMLAGQTVPAIRQPADGCLINFI